jgi:hypothetical protein
MKPLLATAVSLAVLSSAILGSTHAPQVADPGTPEANFTRAFVVNGKTIDTRSYLDQAWEAKGRPGLVWNGRMTWDPRTRQWNLQPGRPADYLRAIAHYASFTAPAGQIAVSIAGTYHEISLADELAKFYSTFLHANFTTLGELRKNNSPEIKQRMLGPELGADSTRTLAWWADTSGGTTLRECYLCNEEYFVPVAGLIEVIAQFKPPERTPAMTQFVSEYTPLLLNDHILRPDFAQEMRDQMTPGKGNLRRPNMSEEEIGATIAAIGLLGGDAADPKLVAIGGDGRAKLRDLVRVAVERFQHSRTLTTDAEGRICASYFNSDYDWSEDFEYAGYHGERFPTPSDKAKHQGSGWDISHFSVVPAFLRTLYDHRAVTGVDFPQKADVEYIANQYAYHVFEGDYKRPLFTTFFDGTDGWYRVSYLGRSGYGVAPSRYCDMADRSHSCMTIAGIYCWGLLAPLHPGLARIQAALLDLARSTDPAIACPQPQCFRERYYKYADFSFSFLDAQGNIQYPPALLVLVSQWASSPPSIQLTRY